MKQKEALILEEETKPGTEITANFDKDNRLTYFSVITTDDKKQEIDKYVVNMDATSKKYWDIGYGFGDGFGSSFGGQGNYSFGSVSPGERRTLNEVMPLMKSLLAKVKKSPINNITINIDGKKEIYCNEPASDCNGTIETGLKNFDSRLDRALKNDKSVATIDKESGHEKISGAQEKMTYEIVAVFDKNNVLQQFIKKGYVGKEEKYSAVINKFDKNNVMGCSVVWPEPDITVKAELYTQHTTTIDDTGKKITNGSSTFINGFEKLYDETLKPLLEGDSITKIIIKKAGEETKFYDRVRCNTEIDIDAGKTALNEKFNTRLSAKQANVSISNVIGDAGLAIANAWKEQPASDIAATVQQNQESLVNIPARANKKAAFIG